MGCVDFTNVIIVLALREPMPHSLRWGIQAQQSLHMTRLLWP